MTILSCGPFAATEKDGKFYAHVPVQVRLNWRDTQEGKEVLTRAGEKIVLAAAAGKFEKIHYERVDDDNAIIIKECPSMGHARGEAKRIQERLPDIIEAKALKPEKIVEMKRGIGSILVCGPFNTGRNGSAYYVEAPIRVQGDWINDDSGIGYEALEKAHKMIAEAVQNGQLPPETTHPRDSNECITLRIDCIDPINAVKQMEELKKTLPQLLGIAVDTRAHSRTT